MLRHEKIKLLVQLAPAATVLTLTAAGFLTTVPSFPKLTIPVVQADEGEEKGEHKDSQTKDKTTDKTIASAASQGYVDGTYYGSAQGYGGTITVQVIIKETKIASIEATDETPAYLTSAKGIIDSIIAAQSADVDTVSGATYSSNGIREAVKKALAQAGGAEVTAENVLAPAESASASATEPVQETAYARAGGWISGRDVLWLAQGFGETITVQVVISGGEIDTIEVTDALNETASYLESAKGIISSIISAQSPNVDTISGATYSSSGIREAVKNALAQAAKNSDGTVTGDFGEGVDGSTAGGNADINSGNDTPGTPENGNSGKEPENEEFEDSREGYKDGTYYGTTLGFGGDIEVKVVIKNKAIKSIAVTKAEDETPSYLENAKKIIASIISAQSPNVDTVSGATYSSSGIREAVKIALEKALGDTTDEDTTDKKPTEDKPGDKPTGDDSTDDDPKEDVPEDDSNDEETDTKKINGTFTGHHGLFRRRRIFFYGLQSSIDVTYRNGIITDISNLHVETDEENKGYADFAANGNARVNGVLKQLLSKTPAEDVTPVSGATCSSKAILRAYEDAVTQAETSAAE